MSTTTSTPATISYSPRPLSERLNWRLVVFLAAIAAPFLYILYIFVSQAMTGGVIHRGDYSEVDLKALGNFAFDQESGTADNIPARFRALDGKKVQLDGFMFTRESAAAAAGQFEFVYNVNKCCFNGPPQVQERVYGHVPKGGKVAVYDQYTFVRLVGTLHVRVQRDETGTIKSVYDLDVEKADPIS